MQQVPVRRDRNDLVKAMLLLVFLSSVSVAHAASSAPVSSTYKYAWSNMGGWINFAPTDSIITVTDSAITGYAWSANDGWLNLSPANSGVKNDGQGNLSGFAWDSAVGWVNFSSVTISSGRFKGQATGANGYEINFDCSSCNVQTAWTPVAVAVPVVPAPVSPGSISPIYTPPTSIPTLSKAPGDIPPAADVNPPAQKVPVKAVSENQTQRGTSSGSASPLGGSTLYPENQIPVNQTALVSSSSPITHATVATTSEQVIELAATPVSIIAKLAMPAMYIVILVVLVVALGILL